MRLIDEVAIVQGATWGMGRAAVERFATEGAKVLFTGRNETLGREVEKAVQASGGDAMYFRADITIEENVKATVAEAVKNFGKVTILLNNAGGTEHQAGPGRIDGKVGEITSEAWDLIFATDLKGAYLSSKYAIPEMIRAGRGSILNVSSFAAELSVPGVAAYSAAKAGLHALTRSIAIEYAPDNIRCNCMLIGLIPDPRTEYFHEPAWAKALQACQPLRVGREDDAANAALFLSSNEASYITGSVLHVDGGLTKIAHIPQLPGGE